MLNAVKNGSAGLSLRALKASTGSNLAATRPSRQTRRTMAQADSVDAKPIRILGISGSLRKASVNSGLLRAAAQHLPAGVKLEIAEIGDLPLYNADLEVDGEPAPVTRLRHQIRAADGILFASPEYNYNVTPALKNALDWPSKNPPEYDNKPAAILTAGGGGGGNLSGHSLRRSGVFLNIHFLNKPSIHIKAFEKPAHFNFTTGDLLPDSSWQPKVKELVEELVKWIHQLQK